MTSQREGTDHQLPIQIKETRRFLIEKKKLVIFFGMKVVYALVSQK